MQNPFLDVCLFYPPTVRTHPAHDAVHPEATGLNSYTTTHKTKGTQTGTKKWAHKGKVTDCKRYKQTYTTNRFPGPTNPYRQETRANSTQPNVLGGERRAKNTGRSGDPGRARAQTSR